MKNKIASDLMTTKVLTATEGMLLIDAAEKMLQNHIGCLPVVDTENNLRGILTEFDIMNFALSGEAGRATVAEAMSREVVSFPPEANFETIANCCIGRRIHRVPVVKNGKVVGIISRHDVLAMMVKLYRNA